MFTSCKKEETDPCEGKICLNGASCRDGLCICEEGYEGLDCAFQKDPVKILLSEVKLIQYPHYNGSQSWDPDDGPDIFLGIADLQKVIYQSESLIPNATGKVQYYFKLLPPLELTDPNIFYEFAILDYDAESQDAEVMASLIRKIYDQHNAFPETLELQSIADSIHLDLSLDYEW